MLNVSMTSKNAKDVAKYLKEIPESSFPKVKAIFQKYAFIANAKVKENATSKIKVRTGNLRRSLQAEVEGTSLSTISASIYSALMAGGAEVIYTPVHEFGATIKAKNAYKKVPGGPYLNIPTTANKTAAGVQRMTAREVFKKGGFIAGKAVILDGKVMFILVKQVKIPARLKMIETVEGVIPNLLTELVGVIE